MYKVPEEWKLSDFLELSNAEKLRWLYNESTEAMEKAEVIPEVSSSDNGKLLGVSEGEWDVVDAPSSLPTVTSSDNGDVLTVVEGAWAKAAPSSGSDIFELKFTATVSNHVYTVTANKTYAEMRAALQAEKIIIANLYLLDQYFNCASYSGSANMVEFVFLNSFYYDSQLDVYDISFSTDSITLDLAYFPLTPGE